MKSGYRIESTQPLRNRLLAEPLSPERLYRSASLAIAVAVKSVSDPAAQEVRVIHVPSGEMVFCSTASAQITRPGAMPLALPPAIEEM